VKPEMYCVHQGTAKNRYWLTNVIPKYSIKTTTLIATVHEQHSTWVDVLG